MSDKEEDKVGKVEEKVYSAFLSDDEKAKLKEQALKELDAENKKRISEEYKASIKSDAKKKALFKNAKEGENAEGLVPVFIDLPAVSECIRLDGTCFYPGRSYNVLPEVRAVLEEIMFKGQTHEDEVSGRKDSNFGRAKRNDRATVR